MSDWWIAMLLVAAGGFAGAVVRAKAGEIANKRFPSAIPYGTLTVNGGGSLLLGALAGLAESGWASPYLTAFAAVGFCGAVTTFSTLKWELLALVRARLRGRAIRYAALSYGLGPALAALGWALGRLAA